MIEKEEDFTRVYIGKDNFQMLVLGGSGTAGKTMTMETIAEEINLCNNHIVIFLTDTKKIFENAHCMFPPQDYKHRQILERVGKAESRKKVKLYHPFTFNLPKHSLPDMNLFTFNINDLSRDEFSMLAESYADSDAIKLLLESQKALKKDENWIDLLHIAQDRVKSKKKKFFGKDISDADFGVFEKLRIILNFDVRNDESKYKFINTKHFEET